MGMFNLVLDPCRRACERCGELSQRWVQFSYGALELHRYAVGDPIIWCGDREVEGKEGSFGVAAQGIGQKCPHCGNDDDLEYDILIYDGVIKSVSLSSGGFDYLSQGNHYWIALLDSVDSDGR